MVNDELEVIAREIRACTKCPLHESRTHGVPGDGPANALIVLVGEAPGRDEDEKGLPFIGRAGRLLNSALSEAGLAREELFITNILKSRPPGNRRPSKEEVKACLPYLMRQLELLKPAAVGLLGGVATESLLGEKKLASVHGKVFEREYKMVPTYHPAAVLRNPNFREVLIADLRNLKKAV
ncbi:MAG: uracil-DNA glycosylase [Candidatus Hydrothermarchaeales archaeon]